MNDTELDAILESWQAPDPSPALREGVRRGMPHGPRKRSYGWVAAAAGVVMTAGLAGVAMLGSGRAQLADGTYIDSKMQVEPAAAQERWHKLGFGSSTGGNRLQGYWFDRATHTYAGYQLTVQSMGDGTYTVTPEPLTKPFPKLSAEGDAAQYRQVPIPPLPATRVVKDGEAFEIDLVHDAKTGDRVFERVELSHAAANPFQVFHHALRAHHMRFAIWLHTLLGDHAGLNQLHLDSPKLYVDGALVADASGSDVKGNGVYFYLPGRGRYVVALYPGDDNRFQAAGTVNGPTLDFQLEGAHYRIVSRTDIASQSHTIYVFHDEAFRYNPDIPELNRPSFGAGQAGNHAVKAFYWNFSCCPGNAT